MLKGLQRSVTMWNSSVILLMFISVALSVASEEKWEDVFARYDRSEKPSGEPTEVHIRLHTQALRQVNPEEQVYEAEITFTQKWNEPKLVHRNDSSPYQIVDHSLLWLPNTYFPNEVDSRRHLFVNKDVLVRVYPNGDVQTTERLSLTLWSQMDLLWLPFDRQVFHLRVASYGYRAHSVAYRWEDAAAAPVAVSVHLPELKLLGTMQRYCPFDEEMTEYSCLQLEFRLVRLWGSYATQLFVPLIMLCTIAWFTFWLSDPSVRITILMFALSLAAVGTATFNYTLPRTSYPKMIDFFTGISIMFIFGALVEFVVVQHLQLRKTNEHVIRKLDELSRFIYPISFVAFIFVYFYIALA